MARPSSTPRIASTVVLSVLLLGAVAMSGCGRERGAGPSNPTPSSAPAMSRGPSSPAHSSPPPTSETTLSGTIIEGAQPSCRILQTARRRYALTGPQTRGLRVGQRVEVTGSARPGLLSPCGATFVVTSVGSG